MFVQRLATSVMNPALTSVSKFGKKLVVRASLGNQNTYGDLGASTADPILKTVRGILFKGITAVKWLAKRRNTCEASAGIREPEIG